MIQGRTFRLVLSIVSRALASHPGRCGTVNLCSYFILYFFQEGPSLILGGRSGWLSARGASQIVPQDQQGRGFPHLSAVILRASSRLTRSAQRERPLVAFGTYMSKISAAYAWRRGEKRFLLVCRYTRRELGVIDDHS